MSNAEAIVFNQALIDQYKPMICKIIKEKVHSYNTSDICYDWEDVFQECLIHLNEAVTKFDDSRGMKFSNFVYLLLVSRVGNFRNKIKVKNFKTTNFSDINGGWRTLGMDDGNESYSAPSRHLRDAVVIDTTEVNNMMLDTQMVCEKLTEARLQIYQEYYIKGYSVQEICDNNPDLKYYQVRRILKYLEAIHQTLVEGTNVCNLN